VGRETNKQRRQKTAVTAREKAAVARAEQQRMAQRRRALTVLSTVVVLVIVAVVIVVIAINRPTKNAVSGNRVTASPTVLQEAGGVSDATLSTIGKGKVIGVPTKVTGEPPLTSGGKPEVLFIGAEFCPYCAVERWSLYEALTKFGTFGNVGEVRSATTDGNYASLDFYKSTYTSKYLSFVAVENLDRNRNTLQNVTSAQSALWTKLSSPQQPGFPFIDFGNKLAITTAPLDPSVLGSLSQTAIAAQLNDPTSKIAQTIGGGANDIIAAICSLTNNQPSTVCSSSTITSLQSQFNA
jgi:hypothetical protein